MLAIRLYELILQPIDVISFVILIILKHGNFNHYSLQLAL